ncbi:hypothetical protein AB6H26_08430 [Providencia hangzhouensis]|uniref:Lipoprotein n=1 Tax=Providencia rettgeri TaxID=587 RepID=A0A9N8D1A6_PRORE|nr:hypothetical protein [Providencia rettgeri]CAB5649657.1 Uncharacterised protein [Providencia rettgeri]CAB5688668.1 Uncharacterised protein [Providencia rettgeri]CAC9189432.1 Uncharacterised protein [Providencia rettgeri]CAC9223953.1 Uncharacterised protein [Providencia rettgeri]BBV00350.1 hypothetical protein BML2526_20020 [Providencia rettgeri]
MKPFAMIHCLLICLLLGCTSQEIAEWNQKVSDFGGQINTVVTGGKQARSEKDYAIALPVDIDTAASRLRRYYGYSDVNAQIAALRQSGKASDEWAAMAIAEEGRIFEAAPGSYYKFGNKLGENEPRDEVTLELEKNGSGTRLYITYRSSFSSHLTDSYVNPLFYQMRDVAAGKAKGKTRRP